ncbi:hypothetical protein E4U43_002480 [Claviceps pusilla]|uniref:Uncharacterized protein n=1 Tax=Claviceps pusilla TaxID=123648 RepID=A0A9P7N8T0_9HYPO|nr:hypothetical protein E4U43_002480 [Claviceps pusilla]
MNAQGQKNPADTLPAGSSSTARSKKQLRHEKHHSRNRNCSSGSQTTPPTGAAASLQDAELSAYERVKKLEHFDRFNGDIEDLLTELIDKVLAGGESVELEPRPDKRDELATLMLWHAEFHALAREGEGGDRNAEDMEMRTLIAEMTDCFDKLMEKGFNKDAERTPYEALIKAFSMKKKLKESRRRRSLGVED